MIAAVGAGGYAGYRLAMPVLSTGRKKKTTTSARGKFITKQGFSSRIQRPLRRRFLKQKMASNDMNTHFEVLKDVRTITVQSGDDKFFRIGAHMLPTAPSWNYWIKLFDTFKLNWIRVKLHMDGGSFVASATDVDEITLPTLMDHILRNAGARVHDTTTDKYIPGRYLPVAGLSTFHDFVGTDTGSITTQLGGPLNPDQQVPDENYPHGHGKAMIGFGVRSKSDTLIHVAIEYGVTFRGLQDSSALYAPAS